MSARPVMMTGVIYPLDKMHAPIAVAFVGNAWDPTLSIGGGPIPPQSPVDPGYGVPLPPGQPIHPIWGPPGFNPPGPGMPPGIGGGPIIPEPPPTQPPDPPDEIKPPPPEGGWGWHPDYGWGYFPGQGGKPQPVPPGRTR